jgi:excisionase family DNA binding protein
MFLHVVGLAHITCMSQHTNAPTFLTYNEVQAFLRVSRHTIWRMATQRGELDQVKVGARSLITRESVERLLGRPVSLNEIQS